MELHVRDDQIGRYFRRIQLGLRLLAHGARPQTICRWTDLTPSQLITLRRRWGFEGDDILRGPSPHSFDKFFTSWTRRHQAALFLSICEMIAVVPSRRGPDAVKRLHSIENGERLCEAFEIFKEWEPQANFDFERIDFLLSGLVDGERIALSRCPDCSSALLIDKDATKKNWCLRCRREKRRRQAGKKKPVHSKSSAINP
jgi:hypothetical protein